jgi:hypothetical protein
MRITSGPKTTLCISMRCYGPILIIYIYIYITYLFILFFILYYIYYIYYIIGLRVPGAGGGGERVVRLSSVTLAQQALSGGATCMCPFDGPMRLAWRRSGSRLGPRRPTSGTRAWRDWMMCTKVTGEARPNMISCATARSANMMRYLLALTAIHRRASSQKPGSGEPSAEKPRLGWRLCLPPDT